MKKGSCFQLFYKYAWYSTGYVDPDSGEKLWRWHESKKEADSTGRPLIKKRDNAPFNYTVYADGTPSLRINYEKSGELPSKAEINKMIRFLNRVKKDAA